MKVSISTLEHRYQPGMAPTISAISRTFEPGTLTCITGPSGSGKSTLLYIMALMLTPSAGIIQWGNTSVQQLNDASRSRLRAMHAGFVFQDAMLDLSRTALDNVVEAARIAGISHNVAVEDAFRLLERFGVAHRAQHRPAELSGGQAQRIALCRALVKDPDIIFADEPTGNLDSESAEIVWDTLHQAADAGATVIVATHDRDRAEKHTHHLRLGE
ncbi:ABC-type lipoprotein export system ATPase subunit [Neomicrococcus aestuarii]|uniref:ABC-type lipoprotein export system ATPase subunit n=1 Tax=Neomicrococcus aestuarii TaxID=556325 RepID=A0A7W8WYV2_9MICC|nr:ATP-binding cassette domain-containing protein [Neomicrococcus aestuarii]MBB5511582.1 ABC-type lipoprotein export system ATPase subunit [Neomicrococcus aestuarii]